MFGPGNMKRPSPETFEQNIRLKKPWASDALTPNSPVGKVCLQNPPVAHVVVDPASPPTYLTPPCLITTPQYHGSNHAGLEMPDNRTRLVSPEHVHNIERPSEEPLLPDDTMDSVDGESLLADEEDAVPEICFGAVSH
jgi:hypothetical protein